MSAIDVQVTLKGHLFEKKIDDTIKRALVEEVLMKVDERAQRQGKGLGAQRNRVERRLRGTELEIDTTRIWPRTKGTAWTRKQIAITKAMAPRVMRKAAQRIVEGR
jgi:hypothetical protein